MPFVEDIDHISYSRANKTIIDNSLTLHGHQVMLKGQDVIPNHHQGNNI